MRWSATFQNRQQQDKFFSNPGKWTKDARISIDDFRAPGTDTGNSDKKVFRRLSGGAEERAGLMGCPIFSLLRTRSVVGRSGKWKRPSIPGSGSYRPTPPLSLNEKPQYGVDIFHAGTLLRVQAVGCNGSVLDEYGQLAGV